MKRLITFLLLFAAIKVAGQTTGYLRFDTVKIMKQSGTCELYIINKTKDSLGLLINVGGGLTQFKKPRALTDSTILVGNDTLLIRGISILNANTGSGFRILKPGSQELKTLFAGYGNLIDSSSNTNSLTLTSDTSTLSGKYLRRADSTLYATQYDLTQITSTVTVRDSVSYINVLKFGLVGDGSTNDATAFQALIDAGYRNFYFPAVTYHYRFATTIQLASNVYIRGDGWKSCIKTVTNDTLFHAAQKTGIMMISLRLVGNQGGTSQIGINLDSTNSCNFTNLVIDSMGRAAMRFTNNGLISPTVYEGNSINACEGSFNGIGLWFDVRGEYNTATNCFFDRNTVGIHMFGGNNNIIGGHYNQNTYGIYLAGTGNNGHHGMATGVAFNHNTSRSLYASQVTLGYRFVGCHFYYGGMQIDTCDQLGFSECNLEFTGTDSLVVKSTTNSYMWNCDFNTTPTAYRVVSSIFPLIQMGQNRFNIPVTGMMITDMVTNKSATMDMNNGLFSFSGNSTNVQQWKFNQPIVGNGGNFDANRSASFGPFRGDYAGSPSITDPFQVFNSVDGSGRSTWAVINAAGGYTYRGMPNGNSGFGITTPLDLMHGEIADAATNTVTYPLRLSHSTSVTAAAGLGVGLRFAAENGSGTQRVIGTIDAPYTTVTNTSEAANFDFNLIEAGTIGRRFTMISTGLFSIGGITSSQPALAANGANLRARLADNSASTDMEVLDEAYDATNWNGSLEVPTKNAVRDKIEALNVVQGTYTPTLTNGANVAASSVPGTTLYYHRIGNQVTVWGMIEVDPTAATTATVIDISLPVASALTQYYQLSGQATGNSIAGAYFGGFIQGETTNDRATLDFTSGSALAAIWSIRFTYEVL